MRCKICGNDFSGTVCPRCGYDESQNREQYPTLADDGKRPPANGALRDALFTSLTEQITATKLGGSPTVQTPTKRQTAQLDHASEILASGSCGSQLTWELGEDGTLTISGSGKMYGWVFRSPWKKYAKDIVALRLLAGIESIGNRAFYGCSSLTDITLPYGLTSIGEFAFYGCEYLERVTVPASVTSIGGFAFEHCPALTIFGDAGSFVEAFARENHIPFVIQS